MTDVETDTDDKAESVREAGRHVARNCTVFAARAAGRRLARRFDAELSPLGLSLNQFTLLTALAAAGPVRLDHLSKVVSLERTALSRGLKPLKDKGFIAIERSGRANVAALTEAGQELYTKAFERWNSASAAIIDEFGQECWNELRHLLHNVAREPQPRHGDLP